MKNRKLGLLVSCVSAMCVCTLAQAQTQPPPTLGQDTKGVPAIEESASETSEVSAEKEVEESKKDIARNPFGTTKIKESRRENGQVYLIELEHSSGVKQYIEETDSDGNIESQATDIEDTPNLPKWKLGSW